MHASVLDDAPTRRQRRFVLLAVLVSIGAHLVVAGTVSRIPVTETRKPQWVEMMVAPPPPPVEAPPPPPPPPPPPAPKPPPPTEVVDFQDTKDVPTPNAPPPPDARPARRIVQGLTNQSFAEGAQTGLQVSAGNTTAARATTDRMTLSEATEPNTVAYASVSVSPKLKVRPLLSMPEEVKAAKIEGVVQVELTIDPEGKVIDVDVVKGLMPAADAACARDLKTMSRWSPGSRDGVPVTVKGVPYTCRYAAVE